MKLRNSEVLVTGASVAGPTLAYWLRRHGFTPTVVERTPALRAGLGGHAVDSNSQIRMPSWSSGRVTLVGEPATRLAGPGGGRGTALAVVGASRVSCERPAATTPWPSVATSGRWASWSGAAAASARR